MTGQTISINGGAWVDKSCEKIRKIIIAGASTFTVKNLGDEAMLLVSSMY